MSNYTEFFLASKSSVVQLELLEISHSKFTKTYRIVRNAVNGVTVDLQDYGINLFNPNDPDFTPDFYVHPNGNLAANPTYSATGYIPLVAGKTYTRSYASFYCYYDENLNPVGNDPTVGTLTFTVPAGAKFGRFSIADAALATFQINEGDTLETYRAFGIADFTYYPLRIVGVGARDNLDFGLKIDLGDLGEVLPTELDAVSSESGYEEKPVVKYRTYRSDDLTAPLFGPLVLEVRSFSFNREGSTFEAKAPALNVNKTGELYKIDRFPMLRGFL